MGTLIGSKGFGAVLFMASIAASKPTAVMESRQDIERAAPAGGFFISESRINQRCIVARFLLCIQDRDSDLFSGHAD